MSGHNEQLFLTSLRALRNTLASAVDQMDVVLDLAERPTEEAPPGVCLHPAARRVPTPVMGHPDRFHCRQCGKEVEE